MKKVMVIGAGMLQSYIIKRIREMGYVAIAVDRDENAVGFKYADHYAVIDIVDKNACLSYAKQMKIDGVLTAATDYGVLTASYIAEKLNLQGIKYEVAEIIKNKYKVREILNSNKVNEVGQFFQISDINNLSKIEDSIKFPVMVKPCDGSGSKGVAKVENLWSLKSACNEAINNSLKSTAIIESFIEGQEYGVESFVYNGEIYVLGIMKKDMTNPPYYAELGHCIPSGLTKELEDKVRLNITKAIRALGVNFGSVNIDLILTDMNEIAIIDIGGRMGGNLIGSHIIPFATGIDYIGNIIDASIGRPVDFKQKHIKCLATRLLALKPGKVKKVPDIELLIESDKVKDIIININENDTIRTYKNNLDGCGYVVVTDDYVENAKKNAIKIKEYIDGNIVRY